MPADNSPVVIDWLDSTTGAAVVLASRHLTTAEPFAIPVATGPGRLLRFSRQGYSPTTVPSVDLFKVERWLMPSPVAGGELVLRRELGPILPQAYRLEIGGARSIHSQGPGEFFVIRGLRPGDYQIVPLYAGGVPATSQRLRIEEGASTFARIAKEAVGGAVVSLHPMLCTNASRIRVLELLIESSASSSGNQVTRILSRPVADGEPVQCGLEVAGLQAGEHELIVQGRRNEILVQKRFEVHVDAFSDLSIEAATTRLSGTVILNGEPLDGTVLEFVPKGASRPTVRGLLDERGNYTAEFEKPGSYVVGLRDRFVPMAGQRKEIEVPPGETRFDWAIEGGTLTVKIDNPRRGHGPGVQFDIKQIDPPVHEGRSGFSHILPSYDLGLSEGKVVFRGLAFATYSVRASQRPTKPGGRRRASTLERFTLSELRPDATVTLTLTENPGLVVIVDPAGAPFRGARVDGSGVTPREIEPGTFSMDGVTPGSLLQIRAPAHTPVCRAAPDGTTTTIAMDAGQLMEMRFPGGDPAKTRPQGWLSWRGSDCPVALDGFPFMKLPDTADGVPRFAISNFPSAYEVSYTAADRSVRSFRVVPGSVLVIPIPKGR